jgi:hypothetical protein
MPRRRHWPSSLARSPSCSRPRAAGERFGDEAIARPAGGGQFPCREHHRRLGGVADESFRDQAIVRLGWICAAVEDRVRLVGGPRGWCSGLKGVGALTAAAMIRRHADIAGVLRDRPLRPADREYLQAAITVVRPVDDLPVALPRGQRDAYPTNEPALRSLAAGYKAEDSVDRLLRALTSLAPQRPRPRRPSPTAD